MEAGWLDMLGDRIIVIALSATRVVVVFLLLPIFASETVPALVRNALFVAIALIAMAIQPVTALEVPGTAIWIGLFAKEVLVGIAIGFLFGLFLWAFEMAGVLIDTQTGSSFALIQDAIAGNEVTLFGELLGRWAVWLFVASGGLLLLVGLVLESFALWPLSVPLGELELPSVALFEAAFENLFAAALMIAAPVIAVLFVVDLSLGLINRFAPQFNVFFLSTAIKSLVSLVLVAVLLPFLVDRLLDAIAFDGGALAAVLGRLTASLPE